MVAVSAGGASRLAKLASQHPRPAAWSPGDSGGRPDPQILLGKLKKVRCRGEGWQACCPAHDDTTPSLDIDLGDDRRILLVCRSGGCTAKAIVKAVGLTMTDLFGDGIEAAYDYCGEDGTLLLQVVRKPGKEFRQRKPDGW